MAEPRRGPVSGRDAATDAILKQVRRFPDLHALRPETGGLDPREAGLAAAIYDQAIRRWLTLRAIVEPKLRNGFERTAPEACAALLAAGAQMLLLDRVPTHAAVDGAVEWTKRRGGKNTAGLVNAVLRRVGEEIGERERLEQWSGGRDEIPLAGGGAIRVGGDGLPEEERARVEAALSLPARVIDRWQERFGRARARELSLRTIVQAPIVLNVAHATQALPEGLTEPHSTPGHAVWTGGAEALSRLLGGRGDVWVQDPGSSATVDSVRGMGFARIIDLCAGRGTKTRQLRAVFPDAEIRATDIDRDRFKDLRSVCAGMEGTRAMSMEALREASIGWADLVLIDAPCSNSAVLARRPEAKYRLRGSSVEELAGIQRQLLADSIPLLSPRGSILYATCSLEPEENGAHRAWMQRWHRMDATRESERLGSGGPGEPAAGHADGGYSVLFVSCGSGSGARRGGR